MDGFLLIDKPGGVTSHDIVDAVRRVTGVRRVGHAGTLDPFATGLLLVGVGRRATREMQSFAGLPKRYEAVFVLGASSDTDDRTGTIERPEGPVPAADAVRAALPAFVGHIEQVPPRYSAVKVRGQKLYEAARKGETVEAPPRAVRVHRLELADDPRRRDDGLVEFPVVLDCSSGTYVRALARDLGKALGTGGFVETLRRTMIGPFRVEDAVPIEALSADGWQEHLRGIDAMLDAARGLPAEGGSATVDA